MSAFMNRFSLLGKPPRSGTLGPRSGTPKSFHSFSDPSAPGDGFSPPGPEFAGKVEGQGVKPNRTASTPPAIITNTESSTSQSTASTVSEDNDVRGYTLAASDVDQVEDEESTPTAEQLTGSFPTSSFVQVQPPATYAFWSKHKLTLQPIKKLDTTPNDAVLTQSPFPLQGHSMCPMPGNPRQFLIFGGFEGSDTSDSLGPKRATNKLYLLSTKDMSLTLVETGGDVPFPRSGHASCAIGNIMIVWGGRGNLPHLVDDGLYLLNVETWDWIRLQPIGRKPPRRWGHSMVAWGNTLAIFGGQGVNLSYNDVWTFDLEKLNESDSPQWELHITLSSAPTPAPRCGHTCVHYNDHLYLFGGRKIEATKDSSDDGKDSGGTVYNDTWVYDLISRRWWQVGRALSTGIPGPRAGHGAAIADGAMYVFGGGADGNVSHGDGFAYLFSQSCWKELPMIGQLPSVTSGCSMESDGTDIILFGGAETAGLPSECVVYVWTCGLKQEAPHPAMSRLQSVRLNPPRVVGITTPANIPARHPSPFEKQMSPEPMLPTQSQEDRTTGHLTVGAFDASFSSEATFLDGSPHQENEATPDPPRNVDPVYAWSKQALTVKNAETRRAPFPLRGHTMCPIPGVDGQFIIFGGYYNDDDGDFAGTTGDVYLLSTHDMTFTYLETHGDAASPRSQHASALVGRVLVVWGGLDDKEKVITDQALYLLDIDSRFWTRFQPAGALPNPRYFHTLVAWGNTLVLLGGKNGSSWYSDMWTFNLETLKTAQSPRWEPVQYVSPWGSPVPATVACHSCVEYQGKLYVFGGINSSQTRNNDLWVFDLELKQWDRAMCTGFVPAARSRHRAVVAHGKMYIFGGSGTSGLLGDCAALTIEECQWQSLAFTGSGPPAQYYATLGVDGTTIVVVGGNAKSASATEPVVYLLDCGGEQVARNTLARLQFTTEDTNLKFTTTDVLNLSAYVRKLGTAAHARAGFSDVWRGELTGTGQAIAIKVLHLAADKFAYQDDDRTSKRFERETHVWMGLKHDRILPLLGRAFIEGVPCLISPWCRNGSVLQYLDAHLEADRFMIVSQVAEGLAYLHNHDPVVIHADIKPDNVLVNDDGNAMLCDFGIARLVEDKPSGFTTSVGIKGTLRYFSKELLLAEKAEATLESDVYAFGSLTLHIITGKFPYITIFTDAAVTLAIAQGKLPSRSDYPEIPEDHSLWELLEQCWDEDPARRPTMDALRVKDFDLLSPLKFWTLALSGLLLGGWSGSSIAT